MRFAGLQNIATSFEWWMQLAFSIRWLHVMQTKGSGSSTDYPPSSPHFHTCPLPFRNCPSFHQHWPTCTFRSLQCRLKRYVQRRKKYFHWFIDSPPPLLLARSALLCLKSHRTTHHVQVLACHLCWLAFLLSNWLGLFWWLLIVGSCQIASVTGSCLVGFSSWLLPGCFQ